MSSILKNPVGPWLVTGASGMLGGEFVKRWANHCVAMVRKQSPLPCDSVEGILAEPGSIAAAVRKVRPSICFHFAACTNLAYCEQNPEYAEQINGNASAVIAEACAEIGARVVYMCTDSIFDGKKGNYAETEPPRSFEFLRPQQMERRAGDACGFAPKHLDPGKYFWNRARPIQCPEIV
jgi:dTDP-4-dehydrorhamnose reductase